VAFTKGVKRTGRVARKKYVPSAKQRAEDARIKEKLEHLTADDLKNFDRVLARAIKPGNVESKALRSTVR
jgi:hypothetical protein